MSGQPQIAGVLNFDVTALETSPGGGIWAPNTIVATNEAFELGASFNGNGFVWQWLKGWGQQFRVSYFAEGIGMNASEADLGSRLNNLTASNNYGPADTKITVPAGTLSAGVYRIACVVTFPGAPGLTGYYEELIMQVYDV